MNKFTSQIGLLIISSLLVLIIPLYTMFWIFPHFTKIITFEKEVNAKQIATHITKMLSVNSATRTLAKESITDSFTEVLKEAQRDFDLTKIKVFSSQGEILYSTDPKDIGVVNTNPYFTDIVAKGKNFSKVVHKDEKTMEEQIVKKDVVETYVPLMRDDFFIGAFEIYYDITYARHSFGTFVEKSRIIMIGVSLLLLLCILAISLSGFTYLKNMRKTQIKMQALKDQVPSLYNLSLDEKDK